MDTLNPQVVSRWLREQAHKHLDKAKAYSRAAEEIDDVVEEDDDSAPIEKPEPSPDIIGVQDIKDLLRHRSPLRRGMIATSLGVGEQEIAALLRPENGFEHTSRGWWALSRNGIDVHD